MSSFEKSIQERLKIPKQTINGKEVILKEGDLCLLDTNVIHSIDQAGENDIVINIMVRTSYFDSNFT
ncbi:hypothetical protein [Metabacillus endolithicus]|uniref:Aspartyl/asparaginy/proline hydroxylase domain-containing protein n=1 Tax=Metabacillus endolithicus TaxID=1535204 RepID=A0ABW5C7F0_9BACI|nr:hypothetical protein [Metabacillus endolithicus]UPG63878.1 hypothetical protein MVE64_01590 [Metabacillus endolithicus]